MLRRIISEHHAVGVLDGTLVGDKCPVCAKWEQTSLFDPLPDPGEDAIGAFHSPDKGAPETEHDSAVSEYPNTGTKRLKVLEAITSAGEDGLTDYEGSILTGIYLYTYAPRRVELRDGGWVEDSGERRPIPHSKKPAAVWRLTESGRYWMQKNGS
jgi:hypothetical protein